MKKKNVLALLSSLAALSLLSSCGEGPQGEKGEKGDQGETGLNGNDGKDGKNGKDGSSILTGEGKPDASLGKEGDLYLDTKSGDLYQKTDAGWKSKGNIKGATGESGENGVSILKTEIDDDGHLWVTYSNGDKVDCGVVKDVSQHKVNFYFGDELLKTVKDVKHGERVDEPTDLSVDGYDIKGWNCLKDGGYRWLFSAYPVLGDLDLYADYEGSAYTVTLIDEKFGLSQKEVAVKYQEKYDFSEVFQMAGYVCTFKDEEGNEFKSSGTYTLTKSIKLYASWSSVSGLSLDAEDAAKGTVKITACSETEEGTSYTVEATPKDGYVFAGWYEGEDWAYGWESYSFTMKTTALSLTAHFISEEERNAKYGVTPEFDEQTMTLTYGFYPQTYVSDATLSAALDELTKKQGSDGNLRYFYKGEYYVKETASPAVEASSSSSESISIAGSEGYQFSDGTTIKKGEDYWFKCEKISWRVLSSADGTYSLVSEKTLNGSTYDSDSNNYADSEIRAWLNNGFLCSAFSFGASDLLQETEVDNSPASTRSSTNPYCCDDTSEFVFLPSNKEVLDETVYLTSAYRIAVATDYARAVGVYCDSDPERASYGSYYWTRSPDENVKDAATSVHAMNPYGDGVVYCYVNQRKYGVRPAVNIKVS